MNIYNVVHKIRNSSNEMFESKINVIDHDLNKRNQQKKSTVQGFPVKKQSHLTRNSVD